MSNPNSKLITIASGKGGVGKTWLSVTLCHILAGRGKKVLLFDGDIGLANVDIQLGLMPDTDLGQVLSGKISLKQAISTFQDDSNSHICFDVISGQSGSGALASLNPARLTELSGEIATLAENYDYTIMDMGAGVETSVMALTRTADQLVVVITADPTSLTDAYAFIKVFRMRSPNTPISIVVNMADDRHAGQRAYETLKKACQNFLKFSPDFLGCVVRDDHVVRSIRSQSPLLASFPQAKAGANVEEIAKKL